MPVILLKPKEVTIADQDGTEHVYVISRVPAIPAREIVTQYPVSAIPRLGDYQVNKKMSLMLLSFTAVKLGDRQIILDTETLVNNHVPDWETMVRLEVAMMEYNVSFFGNGRGLGFLEATSQSAQQWITQTLIPSLVQSLQKDKQP